MPGNIKSKILKYRKWQDAQRSILGKLLLLKGLDSLGLNRYSLRDLLISPLDRPYFDHSFDFNISHAGEYVVCGFSFHGQIGVDVEEMNNIPLEDFTSNFSATEWSYILVGNEPMNRFYNYWTKKEAFLKALGIGLNAPLHEVEVVHNKITWENKDWFLHPIELNDPRHVAHFATEMETPDISIRKIDFY
jgi:4'-phosphopantetheinyl transferase